MTKGYCHLTQIPLRKSPISTEEMVSQLIYGESYSILEESEDWSKIKMDFDGYEGWISNTSVKKGNYSGKFIQEDLFNIYIQDGGSLIASMGSELSEVESKQFAEPVGSALKDLAIRFIGVPYMWGGRTFAGIDCSGFVQIIYKCLGKKLKRDASLQQKQGKAIKFEDITEGDLIFFEREEKVTHVGIALRGNKIIHAHGLVRIDTLDKKGIYNNEKQGYTHFYHSAKRI